MATPMLLSPGQLARLSRNPSVLIVDTRTFPEFQEGHITGAVNLPLMYYHWADTSPEGVRTYNKQMERVFGFIGVSPRKHVVFYEDTSGMLASRGVWLLHYLGHVKASLLDGGLRAWKRAGYKTTTETTRLRPAKFKARVRPEILATIDQVHRAIGTKKESILDVRSPEEYDGRVIRAARGGHIPTATNLNWEQTITGRGTFKSLPELERIYDRAKVSKDNEVITYCQGGYRAAQTYIVLKLLGYPRVRNYLGSWFEWGNMLELPVVSGHRRSR